MAEASSSRRRTQAQTKGGNASSMSSRSSAKAPSTPEDPSAPELRWRSSVRMAEWTCLRMSGSLLIENAGTRIRPAIISSGCS